MHENAFITKINVKQLTDQTLKTEANPTLSDFTFTTPTWFQTRAFFKVV
jgi:hypothetical protein